MSPKNPERFIAPLEVKVLAMQACESGRTTAEMKDPAIAAAILLRLVCPIPRFLQSRRARRRRKPLPTLTATPDHDACARPSGVSRR